MKASKNSIFYLVCTLHRHIFVDVHVWQRASVFGVDTSVILFAASTLHLHHKPVCSTSKYTKTWFVNCKSSDNSSCLNISLHRHYYWQKIRCRERVYPYDIIVHNIGLKQYWVKFLGTIVRTISGNVPTNFELQRLKETLLLKLGEMAAYKR